MKALLTNPLLSEQLLSLSQAARRIPGYRGSRGCNPSTIFRWLTSGIRLPDGRALRLEGLRLAGRWLTSSEAIDRFLGAQHDACAPELSDSPVRPPTRTPTQRRRAADRAARQLEQYGI